MNKTMFQIGFLVAQLLMLYSILEDLTWGAIASLYMMVVLLYVKVR